MSDYVDGVTELKALCGYGLPKSYPLALNGVFGIGALACGVDCNCPCNQNKGVSGFGADDLVSPEDMAQLTQNYPQQYMQANPNGLLQTAAPQSDFAKNFQAVVNTLTQSIAQVSPAFKRGPKAPRPQVVVQHQQDNTTLYVIGGAVIVASVLAIAVGKSGKKA
jgi:hypothetical protein